MIILAAVCGTLSDGSAPDSRRRPLSFGEVGTSVALKRGAIIVLTAADKDTNIRKRIRYNAIEPYSAKVG
jgi:hypothetical protein